MIERNIDAEAKIACQFTSMAQENDTHYFHSNRPMKKNFEDKKDFKVKKTHNSSNSGQISPSGQISDQFVKKNSLLRQNKKQGQSSNTSTTGIDAFIVKKSNK